MFSSCADVMLNTLIVALAFGLGIGTVIYMIGHHSGGHVNPAVTLGMVAAGMTSPIQAVGHIVSQVLGSLIATFLLWVLVPHALLAGSHLGANVVPQHSTFFHAFLGKPLQHPYV
jgi:glycerol uptake facilitator-like aquaporin